MIINRHWKWGSIFNGKKDTYENCNSIAWPMGYATESPNKCFEQYRTLFSRTGSPPLPHALSSDWQHWREAPSISKLTLMSRDVREQSWQDSNFTFHCISVIVTSICIYWPIRKILNSPFLKNVSFRINSATGIRTCHTVGETDRSPDRCTSYFVAV